MSKKPLKFKDDGFGFAEARDSREIKDGAGKDTVVVAMFKRPAPSNTIFFRVSVRSKAKPRFEKHFEIEYENKSDKELRRAFAIAGGALAEQCCEDFGDTLNPDVCSKLAESCYTDLMIDIQRASN